jgi:hypothetical protein
MRTKTNKTPQNEFSDLTPRKDAIAGRARRHVAGAGGCHLRRRLMRVPNAAFPAHLPE